MLVRDSSPPSPPSCSIGRPRPRGTGLLLAVLGATLLVAPGPAAANPTVAASTPSSAASAPAGGAAEKASAPAASAAAPAAAPSSREPNAEELEPAPRVPLAVFAYEVPGSEPELAGRLEAAVGAALRADRRVGLIDLHEVVDAAEPGLVALSKVQEQLEQARSLIDGKKPQQAEKLLEAAHATLLRELGHVSTTEGVVETLREALGLQASCAFVEGDKPKAIALLQAVYNIDRRLRWTSRLFLESMKDFIEEARPQIVNAQRGALTIGSNPGGAQLYLAGKKVGQGKVTLEGLPPGTHYVTWVRRSRRALTLRAVVQPGQTVDITPGLPRYGVDDPVAHIESSESQLGKADMPLGAVDGAAGLRADLLVLLRAQGPERGALKVSAYLYDRRLRTLLKEAQAQLPLDAPEREAPKLAASLLTGTSLDGAPKLAEKPRPKAAPPPPSNNSSITRSKWFWPVVGAVGGAILVGAAVDIALRSR